MRPLRSFFLLLAFLAFLTGLFNIFPVREIFRSYFQTKDLSVSPDSSVAVDSLPDPDDSLSSPALSSYIDSLTLAGEQVRILYYGDSQLEGDRITFGLRKLLRERAGGTGPGLFLPVMPVMYTKSVWISSSANWKRYNILSYKTGDINHNQLGSMMAFCRYLPEGEVSAIPVSATIKIKPSPGADSAVAKFDKLRIFYRLDSGDVKVDVHLSDGSYLKEELTGAQSIRETSFTINSTGEIQISFEGNISPDIYGISIESEKGVIVDNLPQRGSAGLEFTMSGKESLKEMFDLLKPELIILHYGLNIVRNVRNNYSYYTKGVSRQLSLLKEVTPGTRFLVIGVTDMAFSAGDSIMSFDNIPAIIEAQRDAAKEAGALFWDPYNKMGGRLSIVSWSKKMPPLAQNDLVHFTYEGADTLAYLLEKELFRKNEITEAADTGSFFPDSAVTQEEIIARPDKTIDIRRNIIISVLTDLFRYNPGEPFVFSAPGFWLFLLIVLIFYSLIYRKLFLRNFYLLLVSLFFYYKTGGLFLVLLLIVTLIDYTCGILIFRSRTKFRKKLFIILSLVSNLGILAYFKYASFLTETINQVLGTDLVTIDLLAQWSNSLLGTGFDIGTIILPAGISFFTFQSLSYTFDIYRGKLEPVRSISDFGFYVSFFPQLVAGPIVRASEFIPQLYSEFSLTKREFSHALFLISKGLIKKIVISDFIATGFVDRVFDLPSVHSGFENLLAIYGYGLQIYCDFSGYTDIAIGVALILGFRLPINFDSPYKAAGISDFWKRWHISLSRWLKDYLYISLGGNRKGRFRTGINLMITMLLGGLWHGASLKFMIWGGLHGSGLILEKAVKRIFPDRAKGNRIIRIAGILLTFNFVSFCWIFFRAPDLESVTVMLHQIGENFSPGAWLPVLHSYYGVFMFIAAGYLIHFLPDTVKESYRGFFIRIPLAVQLILVFLVAILLIEMRTTEVVPFIYFRF